MNLSHRNRDLGVIHGVMMTGGRDVFRDGIVGMFSISMFSEPSAQHSSFLTNIFHGSLHPAMQGGNSCARTTRCEGGETCEKSSDSEWIQRVFSDPQEES